MKKNIKLYVVPFLLSTILTTMVDINMGGISLIFTQKKMAKAIIQGTPNMDNGYSVHLKLTDKPVYNRGFGEFSWLLVQTNLKYGDSIDVYYDIKRPERFCIAVNNYKFSLLVEMLILLVIFFFIALIIQTMLIFSFSHLFKNKG